jgi:hypothetical protein
MPMAIRRSGIIITLSIFSPRLSSTIRAKNQALNENIDKVMIIPDQNLGHRHFVLKAGFAWEWLGYGSDRASAGKGDLVGSAQPAVVWRHVLKPVLLLVGWITADLLSEIKDL